jgi:tagatose-6-phosphate ketose/aldose isomerase
MDVFGLNAQQLDAAGAHWTAREIVQQPHVWSEIQSLVGAVSSFLAPLLQRPDLRIVLTGAGTSGFIGECLAPALTRRTSLRVEAVSTTDLVASPGSWLAANAPTLLVSFSRSGNSPEAVAAIDVAEACVKQCYHLVVTCDAEGALFRSAKMMSNAKSILLPDASNDRSFAMTSSFTGMLLAAAMALGALGVDGKRSVRLAHLAKQVLPERASLLQDLVSSKFERIVYLGSKELKGLARECALKMLELTDGKVVAIADSPLGFRHGPKTILNRQTLVVVFVCNDEYTRQYDLDLIAELRRDRVAGRIVAISASEALPGRAAVVSASEAVPGWRAAASARDGVPEHPDNVDLQGAAGDSDLELCLPYAMFAQSLALLRSLSLGVRPDNPNAAGTVSRVVKGVTIHPWRGTA